MILVEGAVSLIGSVARTVFMPFLKLLWKVMKFFGLYWLLTIPVFGIFGPRIFGKELFYGEWGDKLFVALLIPGLICVALTTIQNIIRIFRRDDFNIYKAIFSIFKKHQKIGTQTKLTDKNLVDSKNLHGMVFGKLDKKFFIKDENEKACALVIGGTRSGKTSGIAIPTLKSWNGSMFAVDIKGELYDKTAKNRGLSRTKKFDPCDVNAYGYNPYYPLENSRNIVQEIKNIALAIIPPTNSANDKFWVESAQDFLSGCILYYYELGMNFSESMIEIKSNRAQETVEQIMEHGSEKARAKMAQFSGMDEKTLGGIFAEVSRNIDVFATDDDLIRALGGSYNNITPKDLEDGFDVYCCIPEHLIDQWRPLLTMMCNQFFKFFEQRSLDNTEPILFLLDEFPRLGRIESIMGGLSTLAGRNVNIALIIQSKSQLNAVYGADNANIICDNCGYKAILKATEPETQKWCADLVGKYDKNKKSSNYNADITGVGKGVGTGKTTEQRYIIEPNDFGYLAENNKLVLVAPSGYKVLRKIKYWEEAVFG